MSRNNRSEAKRNTSRTRTSSAGKGGKRGGAKRKRRASKRRWTQFGEAFAILLLIVVIAGIVAAFSYRDFTRKQVLVAEEPWTLHVPRGASVWGTWRHLVRDGAVESSRWFSVWVALEKPSCLQAGSHIIPPTVTVAELFETLCQPTAGAGIRVVMPEGLNIWKVADRLHSSGVSSRSAFVEAASRPLRIPLYELEAPTAEGFLFPDTWEFEEGTPPKEILARMTDRFVSVWKSVNETHPQGLATARERWGVGMYEAIVVASIVEKEAMVDDERPMVARVIYNRIERGMRIQCDPTCVYGEDRYRERPSPRWCRHEANAWSTYANDGLPPTPIANPGRASLAAALASADDPDVLYFVARMDGSNRHVFADTYEEHNANVRKYLRGR